MKLNRTIQLLVLAFALTACDKESMSYVDLEPSAETISASFDLTLDSAYINEVDTKAGGSSDIPDGYNLVARMQIYVVDRTSGDVLATSGMPISDYTETVAGNDVADDQLSDLDIFKNVKLLVGESHAIYTQFYFEPIDETADIYIYNNEKKTYTRNYSRESLADDAEDFYVGESIRIDVDIDGSYTISNATTDVTDQISISAKRIVSKLAFNIASLNDSNSAVTVGETTASMSLVYTDYTVPVYNYFSNEVTLAAAATDKVKATQTVSTSTTPYILYDYIFVPDQSDLSSISLNASVEYNEVEYFNNNTGQTIYIVLEYQNQVYSVYRDDNGTTKALDLYSKLDPS